MVDVIAVTDGGLVVLKDGEKTPIADLSETSPCVGIDLGATPRSPCRALCNRRPLCKGDCCTRFDQ